MAIYEFEGMRPRIGATTFVHPAATIIGDVTVGENCFIAPGAVLRGDLGAVTVGDGTNIQEGCVLHGQVVVGRDNHLTHHSIVHNATLGNQVMLGMGVIIMDYAEIGDGCIVGAGCVVLPHTKVPPGKTVVGVPGKIVGDVSEQARADYQVGLGHYQSFPRRYPQGMKLID
jgi:carbonic anhydrase/acetyltransferase-like protein (isoleucine patch superfamily)